MTLAEFLLARIAYDEDMALTGGDGGPIPGDYWWPERILAECEAKRAIIDLHTCPGWVDDDCPGCDHMLPCPTLAALAAPYSGHPDYLAEWNFA